MTFQRKLVALVTVVTIALGGTAVPSVAEEAQLESVPEFDSIQCQGWSESDFEIDSDGLVKGFTDSGEEKAKTLDYLCFPDQKADGTTVKSIDSYAFSKKLNDITEIRRWPANLEQLGFKAFSFNKIQDLPSEWPGGLSKMRGNAFLYNEIKSLPAAWPKNLTELKFGVFKANKLTKLPEWGPHLETIEEFAFAENELEKLPEWDTTNLTKILNLAFAENSLTELPAQWPPRLEELEVGVFKNNKITNLPESWPAQIKTIAEALFWGNELTRIENWPTDLTEIGKDAFYGNNLESIPAEWPDTLRIIGEGAFWRKPLKYSAEGSKPRNRLKGIPEEWSRDLEELGAEAFGFQGIRKIPRIWPENFRTMGFHTFGGTKSSSGNEFKCVAYLEPKDGLDLYKEFSNPHEPFMSTFTEYYDFNSLEKAFEAEALNNDDCGSSYNDVTVIQDGDSVTAIFKPGEVLQDRESIESCTVKTTVPGVSFHPTGDKSCDFSVAATSEATGGKTPVEVEIDPRTGGNYKVSFNMNVLTPVEITVEADTVPGKDAGGSSVRDAGTPLLGVVGGLALLKVSVIIALFLAVPGDGRDLILKRQLLRVGFPECLADAIGALMWKFHKATLTPMGEDGDTDNDGLTDEEEREGRRNTDFGTRPTNEFVRDTDGDGITDGVETARGTDPNVKD